MRSFWKFIDYQQRAETSWEQWQLRQQGGRPVVPEQPLVSCLLRDCRTFDVPLKGWVKDHDAADYF